MSRFISIVVIAFSSVVSVNAATMSMSLANLDVPGRSAEIDVIVELVPGDTLSGAFFSLEANPDVIHVSNSTDLPNWSADNEGDAVGLPLGPSQFAVGSDDPINQSLLGPGAFEIGSFVLGLPVDSTGFEFELAFSAIANNQLVRSDGQFYAFTANPLFAMYSGYWTYGTGSPGIGQMMSSSPRDPLLITPEPTGLVYLVIAAIALFVRGRYS